MTPAIEDTEDDTEEEDESYTDSTNEGMSTPALASGEQESIPRGGTKSKRQNTSQTQPARSKTQSTWRTHTGAGGQRSIKKSNSEPRQNSTGILTADSSSSKLKVKRRASYHVNENGSPVSTPHTSSPHIRRAARKRKVEFDIDSDSSENGHEVVKRRHRHSDYY